MNERSGPSNCNKQKEKLWPLEVCGTADTTDLSQRFGERKKEEYGTIS